MTKITSVGEGEEKIDSSYEVYMALYHQLVGKEGKPDPFLEVQPNFFDLIIVDECHRGSARMILHGAKYWSILVLLLKLV